MAVISISSGLCGKGKEIAKRLSEKLSYESISREVLLEASEQFNIPEIKLRRAIKNAPSILDRFFYGKEIYVSYIRNAILSHLERDNVIYYGLAGHFFLQGISHVLKVRLVSDIEDRIKEEMAEHNTPHAEAKRLVLKDDEERKKWSHHLYGIDTKDPELYDLVVNLRNITVDEAVDVIIHTLNQPSFQTTDKSRKELADRLVESRVKAVVVRKHPNASVAISDGTVHIGVKTGNFMIENTAAEIEEMLSDFNNQADIKVNIIPILEAS